MNVSPHISGPAAGPRGSAGRPRADQYTAGLEAKLAVNASQMAAWELFAASLGANRRRMQALDDATDQPFGTLEDRLDARDAMQQAASGLFAVLDTAQQQTAMQLLPLCCLPNATAMALAEARA
jgi:hypothetical protein